MKPTILLLRQELLPDLIPLKSKYNFLVRPVMGNSPYIQTKQILKEIDIPINGIIAFSDNTILLGSILAERLSLPFASLSSLYKAQNKAVFSEILKKIHPDNPHTVILRNEDDTVDVKMTYPAFLKPAKGVMSENAYKIDSPKQLRDIGSSLFSKNIPALEWYRTFFKKNDPDNEFPLNSYLLQPYIQARQFTVDGFVYKGTVYILGVTESIFNSNQMSFLRFDYPSKLTQIVEEKLLLLVQKLIKEINYDMAGFNIEFYVTNEGRIIIIEMNTRVSLQFIPLFHKRYVCSPAEMMIEISLGQMPNIELRSNVDLYATSYILRYKENYLVRYLPNELEIEDICKEYNLINLHFFAKTGEKLSDHRQDPYSFRFAQIDLARNTREEIDEVISIVLKNLPIVLEKV